MTKEKCREVLALYEATLAIAKPSVWSDHLKGMVPKMKVMLDVGRDDYDEEFLLSMEKFMRWLGFMQGVFWVIGWFGIDDLRRHNAMKEVEDEVERV